MKDKLYNKVGLEVYSYISNQIDDDFKSTFIIATSNIFNIENTPENINTIINLRELNNIRYINKFLIEVNNKLSNGNKFIGCAETFTARKNRKKINKLPIIRNFYFGCEFIFLRVFPKLWGFKKIYFLITRGRNRLLSKAEILGRLVSCGFEILDYESINGLIYFTGKKNGEPENNIKPSYGPLYKMPRIGKNGKIIGVYKFRTMHPYGEFLHDYILNKNGYASSGKPANDFRLTPWGKFLRKYWLDETPQILNIFKGELKLVGVRPVSQRFFDDIPKDLQKLRIKQKPGCIPPYVSLNKSGSVTDVLEAEKQYLLEKEKKYFFTDLKYFLKAIFNIVFKKKRSA